MSRLDMIKEDCRSYKLGLGFDKNYFFEQTEYLISRVEKLEAALNKIVIDETEICDTCSGYWTARAALSESDETK